MNHKNSEAPESKFANRVLFCSSINSSNSDVNGWKKNGTNISEMTKKKKE